MKLLTVTKNSLKWLARGVLVAPLQFPILWLRIHLEILYKQITYLFYLPNPQPWSLATFLDVQSTAGDLLWTLEIQRRLDLAYNSCDRTVKGNKSGLLPHVDTLMGMSKKKKQDEGMKSSEEAPLAVDLVLVGAGHAHAYVAKSFGLKPMAGVRVTIISDSSDTPYSGMLPGFVAGVYSREQSHIDVAKLSDFAGAVFIKGYVVSIDRINKLLHLADSSRPPVRYDLLSIDIGSSPKLLPAHNVLKSSVEISPVKPIYQFGERWAAVLNLLQEETEKEKTLVVVGAGAGGVDLILSMEQRLKKLNIHANFVICSATSSVCSNHNAAAQKLFYQILQEKGIKVMLDFKVVEVVGKKLISSKAQQIEADEVFWCTNASVQSFLKQSGFDCTEEGFMKVSRTLESTNTENVFGGGDCIHFVADPCAKAGVFAVREGPIIAENLRTSAEALLRKLPREQLTEYFPQKTFLGIIGRGTDSCVATKGNLVLRDDWLFDLKDWIDCTWMAGYTTLLSSLKSGSMTQQKKSDQGTYTALLRKSRMRCAGCGSKVGSSILSKVLKRLQPQIVQREEVLLGLESPDDGAVVKLKDGCASVQTLDFFRAFSKDPFVFGQISANHALSDLHAMGAEPVSALALCVLPFQNPLLQEDSLFQMLSGACAVLSAEGCALVGGHSAEGKELGMGLSVTGSVSPNALMRKKGAAEGDLILLTKPIGTGAVLAAQMKLLGSNHWLDAAQATMLRSNRSAGELFVKKHLASSCSDVTGFGLLGHLVEILRASGKKAVLQLEQIPCLEGALECIQKGIVSSLQEENMKASLLVSNANDLQDNSKFQLLFDPQTAGGLLATVSSSKAEDVIKLLKQRGYSEAAIIGRIVGKDQIREEFLVEIEG